MFFNSIYFYNYLQLENCSLIQDQFSTYKPTFSVKFNFSIKEKKRIVQTSDLLSQFFNARPKISVAKKFGKVTSFNISIVPSLNAIIRIFRIIYFIRNSSRKKLINFKFKQNGFTYLILRDFVTLFPFKIKTYDFHDWRFDFVMASYSKSKLDYSKFNVINFYLNFFY